MAVVKRLLCLLLFFSGPSFAAQVISTACINEVAQKLEYRFTSNPNDGKIYAWERHDTLVWGTIVWHNCFLYPISPGTASINGFTVSGVMSASVRTITNPENGKWFTTNAVDIEQEQSSLDWCTQ
ncbi:MAG: hypothetical protein NUV80_03845 [Candidatus Berkelbacteria bacterium]|nr:hypothetical protein [Candidatus Berkelbacteria bacterium]